MSSYSPILLDHFGNPRNVGEPPRYAAQGSAGSPSAGPFMILYLDVEEARITGVGFRTFGCAAAIAAGSVLTELVKGKTLSEAGKIDVQMLTAALGGLPLGKEHCAALAIGALTDALRSVK